MCNIECRQVRILYATLPQQFAQAVDMLDRPYIYISPKEYDTLLAAAQAHGTDFIEYQGRIATFGNCDGNKFAIMPLKECYQGEKFKRSFPEPPGFEPIKITI